MSDKNFKVKSGLQVPSLTTAGPVVTDNAGNVTSSATLPISQGGTGQTTAGNALNALLPLQTSQDNKYLQTNGVSTQWTTVLQPVYSDNAPSTPQVGQVWIESDSSSDSFEPNIMRRKTITATAGQTSFSTDIAFIQGYEQVYFNGMLLLRTTDYTTPTDTSVVLASAAAAGDIVEILSITNLNSINAATTTTNTFTGNQIISSNSYISIGDRSNIAVSGAVPLNGVNINNSSGRPRLGFFDAIGGDTNGSSLGSIEFFDYLKTGQGEKRSVLIEAIRDGSSSTQRGGAIVFYTVPNASNSITERMRITSVGNIGIGTTSPGQKLSVNGSMDAIHEDGAGMAIRIRANASNNSANLQFTNNSASTDWAYIGSSSSGTMVLRTPSGATSPGNYAWLGINGGPVQIRDITAAGGEASDWPIPSLSIASFDDYTHNTMLGFLLKDDDNYVLDYSKWNIKLSDTGSKTTSASTTNMHFGGPGALIVYTGNTESMRITSSGNIGIGTSSPSFKLDVAGSIRSTNAVVFASHSNIAAQNGLALGTTDKATAPSGGQGTIGIYSNDATNAQLQGTMALITDATAANRRLTFGVIEQGTAYRNITFVEGGGNVLVGYSASQGSYKLQVNSQIFATSSTIATSDGRYKDNISTLESGLNIIDALRPVSFTWKEHAVHNFPEGKTVGFIAQEVQEALADYDWVDNLIKTNYNEETEEEFLGIAEGNLIPLLVAAVKELKSRVETLEAANV